MVVQLKMAEYSHEVRKEMIKRRRKKRMSLLMGCCNMVKWKIITILAIRRPFSTI